MLAEDAVALGVPVFRTLTTIVVPVVGHPRQVIVIYRTING